MCGEHHVCGWCGDGWIGPAIFFGIMLIFFLVFVFRGGFRRWRDGGVCWPWRGGAAFRRRQKPLDVLKVRYARGEIDKAEYDKVRADLKE